MELNRIYNENCLIGLRNKIHDQHIDLIITSPPYYNAKEYIQYNSVDEYMCIMEEIFTECFRVLKESRMCIVNVSPIIISREKRSEESKRIPIPFLFVPMMLKIGFDFLDDIIWVKPEGAVPNRNATFFKYRKPITYKPNSITEYLLVFKKPASFLIDNIVKFKNDSLVSGDYERTNVWYMNPETNSSHPAPFPIDLPFKCIKYYSYENEVVLDPFMGSGTTAKACLMLKRHYIGFEINEKYIPKFL